MSFCSIKSCKSTSRNCKGTDVYFHQLQSSSELRKLLKSNVKGKTKSVCVCSKHFLESDYVRDLKSELLGTDKRKILVSGAFPSVNLGDKNNETNESDSIDVSQNVSSAVASNTGISTLDSSEASWRTKVGILCRLCAKSDYGCVPIFKGKSVDDEVKMKIEKYLYIQLNEEDGLPDQVCPGCLTAVSAWHIFAEECLKVNVKLQELLSNEESQELSTLRKKGQKNGKSSEAFMPDQRCAEEGNGDTDIKTEIIKEEIDIEENSLRTAGNTQFENVSLVVVPENLWNSARKSVDPLHTTGPVLFSYSFQHTVKSNEERHRNATAGNAVTVEYENIKTERDMKKENNSNSSDIDTDLPVSHDGDVDEETDTADTDIGSQGDVEDKNQNKSGREYELQEYPSEGLEEINTSCGELVNKDSTEKVKNTRNDVTALNARLKKGTGVTEINTSSCSLSYKHSEAVPSEKEYMKCRVCNEMCLIRHLYNHMKSHGYYCNVCYKISQTKGEYLKHKKEHESGYLCEICGKTLMTVSSLTYHHNTHLPEEIREKFKCDICGAQYTAFFALKEHLKFIHSSKKLFLCDICGKSFNRPVTLSLHVKVHSESRPYKCSHCGKGFKWAKNLRQHMNMMHTMNTKKRNRKCPLRFPFKPIATVCHVCGSAFKSMNELILHVNSHEGVKPFKCTQCEKQFTSKSAKNYHERIHRGEKPFKCDKCDKNFRSQELLKAHYHMHTNTMPYRCKFCDRPFRRYNGWKMHERIHNGDKRYSCEICSCFCSETG